MPKGRTGTIASRNDSSTGTHSRNSSNGFGDVSFDNSIGAAGTGDGLGAGGVSSGVASGSSGDAALTAEQINNRLSEAGPITVQMESRTRHTVEDVEVTFSETPGIATVHSASGQDYTVDYENGECDCPHHAYTGATCRHMEAVDRAMGIARERVAGSYGQQAIAEIDAVDEANRNLMQVDQVDDGHFYTDNMEEFEQKLTNGVGDVPYEYENVLNGQDVTFGLELEFTGGDHEAIARELYDQGILSDPYRLGYASGSRNRTSDPNKWHMERDCSIVDSYDRGGEIVSPVLKDTPETWRNIEKICEVTKRHGGKINVKCGGHVHIGMEPLDTARQRWKRFFKVTSGYEECIYRAAGGDKGRIRSGYTHYAMPFSERAEQGILQSRSALNDEQDVRAMVGRVTNDRYYGINLTNIRNTARANTVEFRYFNGSLNPKQIQANVKLASGIMMAARKSRTRDIQSIGYEVSDNFKRRGKMVNDYKSTDRRSSKKIAEFLDIIFTRKSDKDALLDVFSRNSWR